ncbi:MAG: 50S ribosomal protein L11 methyltransferase [Proteobacteria bacterium]|nr:50S ribosomal protein L11 methyltransferase [Pseudomonadota bacterium]
MPEPSPPLRPDTLLFIYYIDGAIPTHHHIETENFIGNWVEDDFSFLFFTQPAHEKVMQLLASFPGRKLLDEYEMTYAQWQGGITQPVRIGRFLLNPTWIKASPGENEVEMVIDSGVVFGNGAHTTTQACLEAIDIACAGNKVHSMLDLGSGTGILAIAAAKLGCEKIVAVDYNYLAAKTTRQNVILNRLDDHILVVNGRAEEHTAIAADLLVANIHFDVMKDLVRTEGFLHQKWFVLSGLLNSEVEKILDYLATQPVLILKRWNQDNIWHTVLGITQVLGKAHK